MSKIITQSDYTSALVSKRNDLADNIDAKGVDAERTEKLNSLVPKVLEIGGGEGSRLDETKINVMREGDPKLYTFATIADAKTFINSTSTPKNVIIGSTAGVTSIDRSAFDSCISLASITIPSSVTSIGDYAFYNCTSLTSIYIPDSVTNIGDYAFEDCTSLDSIDIPSSVTEIGVTAFAYCTSLTSITIPSSVTSISDSIFCGCTSLTSIDIHSNITSIASEAFQGCTSLTSITIPSSVTSIGDRAFEGCDILILDDYKSRTGYPWGATDILIHNEYVTTTINDSSTERQVPTAKAVYDALAGSTVDAYTKTQTDTLLAGKANLVNGKIPASELPSYVDDVLEYASTSAFPATGEAGKIYIATDTNKTYRWGGSAYAEISESLALGETSSTAYAGNKGKANADAIAAIKDGTNIDSFGDVETALADKVDKVSGKGLSTNDFTNTDKTNLTTALAKANAAAPQAATYTKFEVDQALSAKLGFSDVDTDLSSTSTKPVQNKAVQAPLARLVDAGAKNLLKITATSQTINGVTFTVNDDGTVTVNGTATSSATLVLNTDLGLESGSYVLSGCPSGGSGFTYYLYAGGVGVSSFDIGNSAHINGAAALASICVGQGTTVNNLTFKPMICTAEDYAISPEFVPYAKSNYELTDNMLTKQDILLYTDKSNTTTYTFNKLANIDDNLRFNYGILIGGGTEDHPDKVMIWHIFINTNRTVFFTKIIGVDTMTLTGSISDGVLTIKSSATIYGGLRLLWLG